MKCFKGRLRPPEASPEVFPELSLDASFEASLEASQALPGGLPGGLLEAFRRPSGGLQVLLPASTGTFSMPRGLLLPVLQRVRFQLDGSIGAGRAALPRFPPATRGLRSRQISRRSRYRGRPQNCRHYCFLTSSIDRRRNPLARGWSRSKDSIDVYMV